MNTQDTEKLYVEHGPAFWAEAKPAPAPFGRIPEPDDLKARLDLLEGVVRRIDNQLHAKLE